MPTLVFIRTMRSSFSESLSCVVCDDICILRQPRLPPMQRCTQIYDPTNLHLGQVALSAKHPFFQPHNVPTTVASGSKFR